MSVYSLETQSAFRYYAEHREKLKNFSDREYANTYFLIGEKINKREQNFSQVMVEFLCTENCELINYINDKLNGKLEPKKDKGLEFVETETGGNITYNITNVYDTEMVWGDDNTNGTQW